MKLWQAHIGVDYQIDEIDLAADYQRHLAILGIRIGSQVRVLSKTKTSLILMLKTGRLAFDQSILDKIEVQEISDSQPLIPLSELSVSEKAVIKGIYASKEAKRRLMDMGLTRGTTVQLCKRAPLGDPLDIKVRGYDLSLRQSEAQLISVAKVEIEELP
ncbi:FeoA family protein [Streptococcus ictaluri]|uniref:FeoA domain protein n=1 Tax=Streptococcus ictaluri 707-05 TaxID=764299 RepID=G5K5R9_9STRE|nr:ferrous iron transport protein A [Streptococcus ictaluri]EHI68598.1 FeoA domain protein [Streptococcus ictaluri 707-05]